MAKPKSRIPLGESSSQPFNNVFGQIAGKPTVVAAGPQIAKKPDLMFSGKVVVRHERKGRGGKTVTIVSGLQGREAALEALAKDLRKALGCGATVEDDTIVLQGDQTDRCAAFLSGRGARCVVVGN